MSQMQFVNKSPRLMRSILDIAASMVYREEVIVIDADGKQHVGKVIQIDLEDGSGHNFNVYFHDKTWCFVRFA